VAGIKCWPGHRGRELAQLLQRNLLEAININEAVAFRLKLFNLMHSSYAARSNPNGMAVYPRKCFMASSVKK
jgi:hypothetical protein